MAKVVIDANVIISAAFGGNPFKAVARAMKEDTVYISKSIEQGLNGVFLKLIKKLTKEQLTFLQQKIVELIQMAKMVSVTTTVEISRDAKDDHYLALCKEVAADFLITGDKDLLALPHEKLLENGIQCRILTPLDFLER
ncbi:putative toxin-antitoxin system toxin component, PIN family [bacterium]|nr:putative toxin-antitoxin system toxin component, PIN family [bacterium]